MQAAQELQAVQMQLIQDQVEPQVVRYDEIYYPRTDKRAIKGNQYTFQGNKYQSISSKATAVQQTVNQSIVNQEIGKCPIEYTNQISRAKVFDMKGLKV